MENVFTQKLKFVIIGLLLVTSQVKAEDVQKVDYTDYLKNPSFEFYEDGTPLDVTNATGPGITNSAYRATPPGWKDNGTVPAGGSYGINRNAVGKNGFNQCWVAPNPFPAEFELYQKAIALPAGQYIVSCRMVVFKPRLTNQRLFVETISPSGDTTTIVQYFGASSDYDLNLTAGEINNYAGWEFTNETSDGESRLKPMSVLITVAEGDTLRLGVKSGNWKKDGSRPVSQEGFIKMDDFRITRYVADPMDYTHKIVNPSFELLFVDGAEKKLMTHNITSASTDPQRGTPYGWSDMKDGFTGTSYGVNSDANNMDGAKICWAQCAPFPGSFTLYQDVAGLPAGKYLVSCSMFVDNTGGSKLTTQRLFANEKVQYYATDWDYYVNLEEALANITFAGWSPSSTAFGSGLFMRNMSVEVTIAAGDPLRIGLKTSNVKSDGALGTGSEGWFKVDNFRLKFLGSNSSLDQVKENTLFSIKNQEGGFILTMKEQIPARMQVLSLAGQSLYNMTVNNTDTFIALPKGLYIVLLIADGKQEVAKILVK